MSESTHPARLMRAGYFQRALDQLDKQHSTDSDLLVTRVEALNYVGQTEVAVAEARRLLRQNRVLPSGASKCTSVLGDQHWYSGDFTSALLLYQKALTLAEQAQDVAQICRVSARLLECVTDKTGFDSSLALANQVRKCAVKHGDVHLSVFTHITFGRLEGKVGHFDAAKKHFALARRLLVEEPSAWLASAVDLDESGVLSMLGDVDGAVELAERGAQHAQESGWSRGKVAAAANLAFLYVSKGRLADAETQFRRARQEPFDSPSYRLALADTRARAALASHDYRLAEQVLDSESANGSVQRWYDLVVQDTRARLLLLTGRAAEAAYSARSGMTAAKETNVQPLVATFRLLAAEAEIALGRNPRKLDLPLSEGQNDWPLGLICTFGVVLSKALEASGVTNRAALWRRRAERLLDAVGMVPGAPINVRGTGRTLEATANQSLAPDLDSAVALLELAGHPHILGREAFAILQEAGCCDLLVLAATGPAGIRVIAVDGADERQALAAVRAAPREDLSVLGPHRDETWQLFAQPRPDLEHRCTVAAIRKLLATGRALDQYRRDEKQRAALWPAEALDGDPESIWVSEQSAELLSIARRIAPTPLPILLTGETGTGKEMLARAIHRASDRADRPLVPFNCSAVPREMLESQLFGYRKGAFTGADASFPGVIRAVAGGTLFLDEIADIGLELQPKLLRFLDYHEIHPLGEPHPIKVDVRIVAATNANLEQMVAEGRFREDLFYRLNVVRLKIPSLRERREEIPPLAQHYLRRFSDEQRKRQLTISDELLEYLVLFNWPGNIRQLANEMRRLVALAESDSTLTPALLSPEILASRKTIPASSSEPEIRVRLDQPLPTAVDMVEQVMVRYALERARGRVEEASRLLGISRKGLFLKRRRWGLRRAS
jgi:DNA-binding NtrC family response regulator/Flp pilus assembly protein TadD